MNSKIILCLVVICLISSILPVFSYSSPLNNFFVKNTHNFELDSNLIKNPIFFTSRNGFNEYNFKFQMNNSLKDVVEDSNPNDIIVPSNRESIDDVIEVNHNLTIYGKYSTKLNVSSNKGIFKVSPNVTLNIANLDFNDLNISYDCGIIENRGNLTLNNCGFSNNKAIYDKGYVVYNLENSNSTIIGCSFNDNLMGFSSVIYSKSSDNVNISSSTFKNNKGNGFGSAINNDKSKDFIISDSVFDSNTGDFGGAIYNLLFSNKRLNIESSNFTNNHANIKGGTIYNRDGAGFTLSKSNLINNTAEEEGGGAFNENSDDFKVKNSVFNSNKATRGGGVYTTSALSDIEHSNFIHNRAGAGGGVYNSDGKKYSYAYYNSTFADNGCNDLNSYGGAIFLNNANFQFTTSKFLDNSASKGGAIFVGEDCKLYLKDTNFGRNKLNSSYESYGGAIYSDKGGTIENMMRSNFIQNSATYGGSIFSLGDLSIQDSVFTNNNASSDGGSIYSPGRLTAENSAFNNNNANNGGAIYKGIRLADFNINTSTFNNNHANNGGAIYNEFSKNAFIDNSTFNNNIANVNGGSIYNAGSYFNILNSYFNNSKAATGNAFYFKAMYITLNDSYIDNQRITYNSPSMYVFDSEYYNKFIYINYKKD